MFIRAAKRTPIGGSAADRRGRLLFLQHFMGTLDNWVAASQIAAFRDWEHDSGHGPLFQFHESFTRHAAAFLASDSPFAPY